MNYSSRQMKLFYFFNLPVSITNPNISDIKKNATEVPSDIELNIPW